jgi:hypothetical protein
LKCGAVVKAMSLMKCGECGARISG